MPAPYAREVPRTSVRRRAAGVAGGSLLAAQLLTGCSLGSATADDGTTRLLLVGDSITQGRAGDWTWRYRLWQRLEQAGDQDVDFVGPASDLDGDSVAYRDPDFDRDHAAWWGTPLTPPAYPVGSLGRVYRPDVAVIELGVNDLLKQHEAPADVAAAMRDTVGTLRAAAPGLDVVLVHVPVVTIAGVAELNGLYDELAAELDTEDQRVVVAYADVGFVSDPAAPASDSYDGLHPNESGEVKIADAVAAALLQLGIGEEA